MSGPFIWLFCLFCVWSFNLCLIIQFACDHSICVWSFNLRVVIQFACGHSICVWSFNLRVVIQFACDHSICVWSIYHVDGKLGCDKVRRMARFFFARGLTLPLIRRVGQNRIYTPYIWWFPCQKHRIYTVYIWFWPTLHVHISTQHPGPPSLTGAFLEWTGYRVTPSRRPILRGQDYYDIDVLRTCTHICYPLPLN